MLQVSNVLPFLIVIAFALWKVLRQRPNGAGGRPARPMPSFGGGPSERKIPAPKAAKERQQMPKQEEQPVEPQGSGIEQPREAVPSGLPIRAASLAESLPDAGAHQQGTQQGLQADKDDLMRAVVWAEILGPPRAKKPYGRS